MEYKEVIECVDELKTLFKSHLTNEPDTINQYILETRPQELLFVNLLCCCKYVYSALISVAKRYRICDMTDIEFIKYDTMRLCVLMFKPYFSASSWITNTSKKYAKLSSDYKFNHGIVDEEPPDDIYNSTIVYLEDFVINLAI